MDGYLAPLEASCDLAERYDAMVIVDDSHAVGFTGPTGAGTTELTGAQDRVDIISGTLGNALSGASGGYIAARREIVDLLRQRSRPYLLSNALAPSVVAGSLAALDLVEGAGELRELLRRSTERFRPGMEQAAYELLLGEHPVTAVMFHDARLAGQMADAMLEQGLYVTAFSFPVVPRGEARIRVQLSAAHSDDDVDRAVAAFTAARESIAARWALARWSRRSAQSTVSRPLATAGG